MAPLSYPPLAELRQLLAAPGASPPGGAVASISTDSRLLQPGALFVALLGERYDGHDYVAAALARGAVAAVVQRPWRAGSVSEWQLLRVASPLQAYQTLARWQRQQFGGPVIAVTGSVGKTTTKELIAAALGAIGPVLATAGNLNHETGVPLTLLKLQPDHGVAVIEMGMRGLGQILELGQIALPNVAVITNVGTAHIGLLGSREQIAQAKCELLATLDPAGIAVLNADCPLLLETARSVWRGKTLTFGLTGGEVHGELVGDRQIAVAGQRFELPLTGVHNAMNFLAALAVARHLGVSWDQLRNLSVVLPPGRARRLELSNQVVVLDESYNAGPESTVAALELLAQQPARRRIAVLGTMMELGDHSVPLHRQVGEAVAALGLDLLLVVADSAEAEALTAGAGGVTSRCYSRREPLVDDLRDTLRPGDCVLLKASRAVGLDQVLTALADESSTGRPSG
ncbi:MAG: UDP-N-acetylmuramoyl-tripeptide--D-alanyl-D-alanine ligase [Deltaproteobacteria bacterium]|nr:MAG: UDP-N-acetylmuramoyl-tripeptide--D-alanyl-D-alanine ligase [Deltaproteobacteria bacterium]